MPPATILISGGLDSTVLLHYVAKRLHRAPLYSLSFNYAQRHVREPEMAAWQSEHVAEVKEHHIIDLTMFEEVIGGASSLVAGGERVPSLNELKETEHDQPPTYVPNRNMILLSLAAAFAESRDCDTVYYGAQAQDMYGYWDCTSEFIERMNRVLSLNRRTPVKVAAPFVNKSKAEEISLGHDLGVDFAHTWSCYRGKNVPCGECPTCVERRTAFEKAGFIDPLARNSWDETS
ncbi:MAG: 7-cyano-7-deazaguanine synthase QueC [Candidatus Pacebacteria bacterium]|nr:7-cyano-7-deazaguanine synthase QueC [Candidatus Paceibacterota bacterium]